MLGPLHLIGGSVGANVVLGNNSTVYDVGVRLQHGAKYTQAAGTRGAQVMGLVAQHVDIESTVDATSQSMVAAHTTELADLREKVNRLEKLLESFNTGID